MLDPIGLTVASMLNDMVRMDVVANNSANALTPGFKRQLVAAAQDGKRVDRAGPSSSPLLQGQVSVTDRTPGTLRQTGNALDVALLGDGYLEIRTEQGLAYTRTGMLHLDEQGRLVTQAGYPVQGLSGEIVLSDLNPVIDREGRIFVKDKQIAQIKVVDFEHSERLRNLGAGGVVLNDGAKVGEAKSVKVIQKHLENSNVDSAREMISLMETFRHFESSHRVLQAYDDVCDKTFRNLGQF